MSHDGDRITDALDRYLDGAMSDAERASFESMMQSDDELRREMALQQQIDAVIRERFAPPLEITAPALGRGGSARRILAATAAAAAIALGAFFAWPVLSSWWNASMGTGPAPITFHLIGPAEAYRTHVEERGLVPEWECTTDAEFASTVKKAVGAGMVVAQAPGLEVIGWSYNIVEKNRAEGVLGRYTMYLLTRVDGEPVLVLMDQRRLDRQLELPPGSSLNLFRSEIGDAVLYEVTPLETPRVLDRFVPFAE